MRTLISLIICIHIIIQACFAIPFEIVQIDTDINNDEGLEIGNINHEMKRAADVEAKRTHIVQIVVNTDFAQEGEPLVFQLFPGLCFIIFGKWGGNVRSIRIPPGECVKLFDMGDCTGINLEMIGGKRPDLEKQIHSGGIWKGVHGIELC